MIICNCTFVSRQTEMKDFYQALKDAGIVDASRADHGNVCYDFYINPDDSKSMFLLEKWETMDDLQAHSSTEIFQKFAPTCKEYHVHSEVAMYEE